MKLSKEELQQLIESYRTELRLLNYRADQVSAQISELEMEEQGDMSTTGVIRRMAAATKRGRSAKRAASKRGTTKKRAAAKARPAKKATKKATKKTAKKATKKAAKKSAKKASKKAAKKAPRKTASKGGGYRLNAWDEIVLKTLSQRKNPGVFADFFKAAKKTAGGKRLSQKDLYARINQSLHKLANKRGAIKKVAHEGRGYGYVLAK